MFNAKQAGKDLKRPTKLKVILVSESKFDGQ